MTVLRLTLSVNGPLFFLSIQIVQIRFLSKEFGGCPLYATLEGGLFIHAESNCNYIRVFRTLYKVDRNGNFYSKDLTTAKKSYLQWGST